MFFNGVSCVGDVDLLEYEEEDVVVKVDKRCGFVWRRIATNAVIHSYVILSSIFSSCSSLVVFEDYGLEVG